MLQLKPTCEHCDTLLPADSTEARICSYECTFCANCVESVLLNVCPNCGGGFAVRPIRPTTTRVPGTGLLCHAASTKKVHKLLDVQKHHEFARELKDISPHLR